MIYGFRPLGVNPDLALDKVLFTQLFLYANI